jgi:hypothetical protein
VTAAGDTFQALWLGRFGGYLCHVLVDSAGQTPESIGKPPTLMAGEIRPQEPTE